MPHITIEYSANLDSSLQIDSFIEKLHMAAIGIGLFPIGGIRTRAARRDHFRVADGKSENGFVHIDVRIGPGREKAAQHRLGESLFEVAISYLDKTFSTQPLALSLEVRELSADLMFRKNNLHSRG